MGNFLENDNKMLMAHPALGDRYTFCVQKMPLFFFFFFNVRLKIAECFSGPGLVYFTKTQL